jgi:hypothetical protein
LPLKSPTDPSILLARPVNVPAAATNEAAFVDFLTAGGVDPTFQEWW